MTDYETLLDIVYGEGQDRLDRTETGIRSLFGGKITYDLQKGFPLITSKRVPFKLVASELLWFLSGNTNIKPLLLDNNHIWDEWADENGDLGPVYGKQWRKWETRAVLGMTVERDQIGQVIDSLRTDPYSRRHIVSAWNVGDLDKMALPPCHVMFQFYVEHDNRLSIQVYQRSADMFLGVPFNLASYALLTHMVAQQVGMGVGTLHWVGGDCHIYHNHLAQVEEMSQRSVRELPKIFVEPADSIDDYSLDSFKVIGYNPHPTLKGEVAV